MSDAVSKVREEIAKIIPPTIFFFIMLHLVALERSLMLRGTGIPLLSFGAVTVAALVLGKAVLLADALPLVNRYPDKPLAYNVVWKTTIYVLWLRSSTIWRIFTISGRRRGAWPLPTRNCLPRSSGPTSGQLSSCSS